MKIYVAFNNLKAIWIAGEYNPVLRGICDIFKVLKDYDVSSFNIEEREFIRLDPGGMINIKDPDIEFEVNGIKFQVPISKVFGAMELAKKGEEVIEGYIMFAQKWWNVVIPKDSHEKLINKLHDISNCDEALNASLSIEEKRKHFEDEGVLIRMDTPRR